MADADDTDLKRCSRCKLDKSKSEFHKNKACKDGLCHMCKRCNCAHVKAHRDADPQAEKVRKQQAHLKHRDKRLQHAREHRVANIEAVRAHDRERGKLRTPEQKHGWYMNRREQALAKNAEWARKNPERVKAAARRWLAENAERSREIKRASGRKYPEKNTEKTRRRQAAKRNATPMWADREKMLELYREAQRLSEKTGILHHVDHCVPLKHPLVQGFHCEANMQVLPHHENERKSNRHWPDMP